jgi:hypothetical protein
VIDFQGFLQRLAAICQSRQCLAAQRLCAS